MFLFKRGRELRGHPDDQGHRDVQWRGHLAATGHLQILVCNRCWILSLRYPDLHAQGWILDLRWISGGQVARDEISSTHTLEDYPQLTLNLGLVVDWSSVATTFAKGSPK